MNKKDDIDKLLEANLEELNENEPQKGHFERFQEKLKKQNQKKKVSLGFVLKIAAAVVFVFLAVNQAFIYFGAEQPEQVASVESSGQSSLASVSPEFEEVEFYYTNAIRTGLSQWEEMVEMGLISEEEQAVMDSELKEFENIYSNLQEDLETNPNDERVINAMLEYYKVKLSVISMIITKLEEVKQEKNRNHENEI